MKLTVLAPLITSDGTNSQTYFSHDPADLWQPIKRKVWSIPASEVRAVQASDIPLREHHGGAPIGRIVHLERSRDGVLWAVGELDEDPGLLPDHHYYLSVEAVWYDRHTDRDIEIRGAALCSKSAMLGLWPAIVIRDGLNIRNGECTARLPEFQRAMLATADKVKYRSRYGEPIHVRDATVTPAFEASAAPPGALRYRTATRLDVRPSKRTIEIIVMPYERETLVKHEGRAVTETIARGAFDGIEHQTNRIRVNRDHQLERTVGRVTALHPARAEGLVAELAIAHTPLGDETLALAREDCLDASAGFAPIRMDWQGDKAYRVTKAWLGHIALVPDPAYVDARVLAVN